MADDYNAQLAQERHDRAMEKLDEINTRLKAMNGSVNNHETRIAVLEDRTPGNPGRQGGAWGAVAGAVGGFLAGLIKQ